MTDRLRKISRALLSVSDKAGLFDFARALAGHGVELVSTGGTRKALADAGLAVREVSELTGFPEMMDGRLKTLHPKVHGGLLAIRDKDDHVAAMRAHGIAPIDLLVVNLYPFEATVASNADFDRCIENIDIGGPAMIRAAAKNHADVAVVVDPDDYALVLAELAEHGGATTLALRQKLAAKAYARTGRRRSTARPTPAPASPPRARCRASSSPTTTSTTPTRLMNASPSSTRRAPPPASSSSTPIRAGWPREQASSTPTGARSPAIRSRP